MYQLPVTTIREIPAVAYRIRCGPGKCSHREIGTECPCPEYSGKENLCENCGHQYSEHW